MTRAEPSRRAEPPGCRLDLLAGAAWVRTVFRRLPVEDDFVPRAVATVLTGAAPSA
ncbi:hypothetical protein ACIRD3_12170 [Kitasatospora sp. NPDC093550]|uniref:hypothetical protein n=1 Tax=Kitasatospora sp. NPDC093550 TaxID=3364089 RepID=UPI0037F3D2B2